MNGPSPQHARRTRRPRPVRRAGGFTLIEAALTTVIIGTGVLAILAAQQGYHRQNGWTQRIATGVHLANEVRELTLSLPTHDPLTGSTNLGPEPDEFTGGAPDPRLFDDLDDFAGVVTAGKGAGVRISPPINGLRERIAGLDNWAQYVSVVNVLPENIGVADSLAQPLGTTDMMRVTVRVTFQESPSAEESTITTLTWVVGYRE